MKNVRLVLALALFACGDDDGGGNPDARINFPDAPRAPDGSGSADARSSLGTCAMPHMIESLPATGIAGSTVGTGDNQTGDCAFGSASSDYAFQVMAPGVGELTVTLHSEADLQLYARTACTDTATQLACMDDGFTGDDEVMVLSVAAGPVFIFVDGWDAAEAAPFTLDVSFMAAVCGDGIVTGPECEPPNTPVCDTACSPLPENTAQYCTNFLDDDRDGLTDCADTTMCQAEAHCAVGAGVVGAACTLPSACAATGSDPACLDETNLGWPGGHCSEHCSDTDACPAGSDCLSFRDATLCIQTCPSTMDTECENPAAYDCVDVGNILTGPFHICLPKCTDNTQCPTIGRCDLEQGLCRPAEAGTCGDTVDTDQDGDLNCGDVECLGDAACSAVTEVEPNDATGMATTYAAGFIGAIGLAGDNDYVSIAVAEGMALTAEVNDLTGAAAASTGGCTRPAIDSYITIYGPDGTTVIDENEDIDLDTNWCSRIVTGALAAGTYYVRVQSSPDYAPMDTFVYGLTLTVAAPSP